MSETIVKAEPAEEEDEENGRTTPERKSVHEYKQKMKTVSPSATDMEIKEEIPTSEEAASNSAQEKTVAGSTIAQETADRTNDVAPLRRPGNDVNASLTKDSSNTKIDFTNTDVEPQSAAASVPMVKDDQRNSIQCAHETKVPEQATQQKPNEILPEDSKFNVLRKDEPPDSDMTDLEMTMARLDGQSNNERPTPPSPPTIPPLLPPQIATPPPPPPHTSTSEDASTEQAVQNAPEHLSPEAINALVKEELQDTEFSELEKDVAHLDNKPNINENANDNTPPPPKISTVPMIRLRVKPEFTSTCQETLTEYSSLPQDFFEGILTENLEATPKILPDIRPKDEPIPDNFFDDLLVDKVQERIEEAETQDLEVKYVDRLKQLEELEQLEREKRKHKKSKKKSRKRPRTPSPPTRRRRSRSHTPEQVKHRLMRWPDKSYRDDRMELPSTSRSKRSHKEDDRREDDLRAKLENKRRLADNVAHMQVDDEPIKKHAPVGDIEILEEPVIDGVQPHLPELRDDFTPKQKRDRIILRAKTLITYLDTAEAEKDKPLSTFLYTSIVRRLPASHSYRNQHIYENRSPLHNINNVSYKFNSHARRFNLEEWGLASLPPLSANIAKLVGCDALAIHNKLKVIKVPAKIRKLKTEDGNDEDEEEDETLRARSSLFCNASTQTDEMVDILKRKPKGWDIGVQAVQPAFEIACQTLETESPSMKEFDNNDDLPIMEIMRELNENQLMALHDFAELLKEPASNAMDMYRLRQRMLDIYKCSQLPSAMSIPTPVVSVNSYTSHEPVPALRIHSAAGADGSCFSANDPRVNFTGRFDRAMDDDDEVIRNVNPYDPRIPHFARPQDESRRHYNGSMSNQRQRQQQPMTQRKQPSSNGPKFYGRGGLRR